MTVSVDWINKIISVEKTDLTLIQSTPKEIYELELVDFHLILRSLEASSDGMPNDVIHNFISGATLSSIKYADTVEIINDYTITFEDGQYAVNLIGANTNIADATNVNQVSVRPNNSAGLISSRAIEFSSFLGGVTIDATSDTSGTLWPAGTPQEPVNNLEDAKTIAQLNGLSVLYIIGDFVFTSTDVIDGYTIIGNGAIMSNIVLQAGLSSIGCRFKQATISGVLSGNTHIEECEVGELTYVEGRVMDSTLFDVITLAGSTTTNIINCRDGIAGDAKPIIDMGGSGQALTVTGFYGEIKLRNKTGLDKVSIDIDSGEVELDPTVTNGEIYVRGNGNLKDNSTGDAVVFYSALNSRDVYTDIIYIDVDNGGTGKQLPMGTQRYPVNNITDAKAICEKNRITRILVKGSITLTESFSGFVFESPYLSAASINLNNQNVTGSVFKDIVLSGNGLGRFEAIRSYIFGGMSNVYAAFEDCIMSGTFSVYSAGSLSLGGCKFNGPSTIFDLSAGGSMSFAGVEGIFAVTNLTSSSSVVAITGNLICTLSSSCTGGVLFITGNGTFIDLSAGTTVHNSVINPSAVWEEQLVDHQADGTVGNAINKIKTWVNYLRST